MNDCNEENYNFSSESGTLEFQKRLVEVFCDELNILREADSEARSRLYDQAEFIGGQIIRGER
ncbi:MAG: hypothetical protein V3V99_09250 [candidate division Zixibacteria bacterium]